MIPEKNPLTGHSIGCTCSGCSEYFEMSRHTDFIGQRADKLTVVDVGGVEEIEMENGIVKNGVVKEVVHYTMFCDECGRDGYYDRHGEVICEGCGLVLSNRRAVLQEEYDDTRGFEKDAKGRRGSRGSHEPSVG